MCFVLLQILKQVPLRPPLSWFRAAHLPTLPSSYRELETVMTPHIRSLYCAKPLKGPGGSVTKITSIATRWNGIPGDGTVIGPRTFLNGLGQKDVPGVLELMKQRGWKDHFMVYYEEELEMPTEAVDDAGDTIVPSSDPEGAEPLSIPEGESSQSTGSAPQGSDGSSSTYHPAWSSLADAPVGPPAADHEILVTLLERESKNEF
jgi:hypothetical protein